MRGRVCGGARQHSRPRMLVLLTAICCFGQCRAELLAPLWRQALDTDPSVAGATAQLRAAEHRLYQAKASFGPTASLALSKTETRYNEAPSFDLRQFSAQQAVLQVTQPLYRGALYYSHASAVAQLEQAQVAVEQARAEATVRWVDATFDVMKARDAINLLRAQAVAAEEQLAAARRSFTVGKSPVTDVREAEAKVDTVAAQLIAARSELDLKQQLVAVLVGHPAPELLAQGLAADAAPTLAVNSILEWLADAQLHNPQLRQAQQALKSAEAEVLKAAQGHVPTADLSYTYTKNSDTGTITSVFPRRGDSSQVGLNVNIPLFASGATESKVQETVALRDKARSDVDAAQRAAQVGVRQSFSAAISAMALTRGLETANRSLEVAMRANRRGYEVGMKVNAEVLEAQSKLFEARRDLSRAMYDAWLNFIKLKAFAGQLTAQEIDALDRHLVVLDEAAMRGRVAPQDRVK